MSFAYKAVTLFGFRKAPAAPIQKTKSFEYQYSDVTHLDEHPEPSPDPPHSVPKITKQDSYDLQLETVKTKEYIVQEDESLNSIAVRLDTTAGTLAKLNRFASARVTIFPGQKIKVPDGEIPVISSKKDESVSPTERRGPGLASRLPVNQRSQLRPVSMIEVSSLARRRGDDEDSRIDRLSAIDSDLTEDPAASKVVERQFVKVQVDRILVKDHMCPIHGTLLVTPSMVLFDPDDVQMSEDGEAVIEHGVALPLTNILSMNTHFKLAELLEEKSPLHLEVSPTEEQTSSGVKEQPADDNSDVKSYDVISDVVIVDDETSPSQESAEKEEKEDMEISSSPDKRSKELLMVDAMDETEGSANPEILDVAACPTEETKCPVAEKSSPVPEKLCDSSPVSTDVGLYLCLRGVQASTETSFIPGLKFPGPAAEQFIFLIRRENIDEVYTFLLESAATGAHRKPSKGHQMEASINSSAEWDIPVDFDMVEDSEVPHDSMVADALKEMEEEKYRPQLKGGDTAILTTDSMLDDLPDCFPIHLTGSNLKLLFTTSKDGFNLNTIYRKLKNERSACLLVIRDTKDAVFGALMSEKMHSSQLFYGNGETCVFHWKPDFRKFMWSGKNNYFMKGANNAFSIGAMSGHNAIWFDDILKNGRSEPTETFDNPTLSSGPSSAFTIDCLEVWGFVQ